jgi:hypothetical protein
MEAGMRALIESLASNMSLVELHLGRVLVQGLTFEQVCKFFRL